MPNFSSLLAIDFSPVKASSMSYALMYRGICHLKLVKNLPNLVQSKKILYEFVYGLHKK